MGPSKFVPKDKGKVVPVQNIKAYVGLAPLVPNLNIKSNWAFSFTPLRFETGEDAGMH
jgi:hypothetical protein